MDAAHCMSVLQMRGASYQQCLDVVVIVAGRKICDS